MSVHSHIAELSRRRESLKQEISRERSSPGIDDISVVVKKKQKLYLKDEIERLRSA